VVLNRVNENKEERGDDETKLGADSRVLLLAHPEELIDFVCLEFVVLFVRLVQIDIQPTDYVVEGKGCNCLAFLSNFDFLVLA